MVTNSDDSTDTCENGEVPIASAGPHAITRFRFGAMTGQEETSRPNSTHLHDPR